VAVEQDSITFNIQNGSFKALNEEIVHISLIDEDLSAENHQNIFEKI
jgi:hypothetical protein